MPATALDGKRLFIVPGQKVAVRALTVISNGNARVELESLSRSGEEKIGR
jgi:hypothetical protein